MKRRRLQFGLAALLLMLTLASVAIALFVTKPDQTPALFKDKYFDSALLARAVNHYVDMGESAAVSELESLAQSDMGFSKGFDVNERIVWVCRILFVPKDGSLRPPAFGGLDLPYHSMPASKWPLYPVAKTGGTYCVLSQGYMLSLRDSHLSQWDRVALPARSLWERSDGVRRVRQGEGAGKNWTVLRFNPLPRLRLDCILDRAQNENLTSQNRL